MELLKKEKTNNLDRLIKERKESETRLKSYMSIYKLMFDFMYSKLDTKDKQYVDGLKKQQENILN